MRTCVFSGRVGAFCLMYNVLDALNILGNDELYPKSGLRIVGALRQKRLRVDSAWYC